MPDVLFLRGVDSLNAIKRVLEHAGIENSSILWQRKGSTETSQRFRIGGDAGLQGEVSFFKESGTRFANILLWRGKHHIPQEPCQYRVRFGPKLQPSIDFECSFCHN